MQAENVDLAAVRRSMREKLTAQELGEFCQKHEAFQPIPKYFGPGFSFDDMIHAALDYCNRHLLMSELQEALQNYSPQTRKLPYGEDGYKIIATVIKQEGHCIAGHQVGDKVVIEGQTIEGKICIHALYSFLPKVFALRYGAEFPWTEESDVATHACPDAWNPVVFEIRRIRE